MATTARERGGRVFDLARLSQQELATRRAIEHHKNKTLVWHPLEELSMANSSSFMLKQRTSWAIPRLGVPMIMRRIERGERKGHAKAWSYPGMEKVVQQMRNKIDGVSKLPRLMPAGTAA